MGKRYSHLTNKERIEIETLLNAGHRVVDIAAFIGVHRSTIYRELQRGRYVHRKTNWENEIRYSSDLGQKTHDWNAQGKGKPLKIGTDLRLAEFLEGKIVNEKYSPKAAVAEAKTKSFDTMISARTLYRYIDSGVFLLLTNAFLPVKSKRRRKNHKVRVQKRASAGTSIEKRSNKILERSSFGHWEMDTVKGKRGVTQACMLVLTERKTRDEIIFKLGNQKAESVVLALDRAERKMGDAFSRVFRTITVDNGVEFSDFEGMERSVLHEGQRRTILYYCHPYSSWERGSNENNNRLIRRHIPKGIDFDDKDDEEFKRIENWMNNYPREMFGYRTAGEMFQEELEKIGLAGIEVH